MKTSALDARTDIVEKLCEAAARSPGAWLKFEVMAGRNNTARLNVEVDRERRQKTVGTRSCNFVPLWMPQNGWLATGFVMAGSRGPVDIPKRGSKARGKHFRAICDVAKCGQIHSRAAMDASLARPAGKFEKRRDAGSVAERELTIQGLA